MASARARGIRFRLIAGEAKAVEDFVKALKSHPHAINVLLIDAEGPDDGALGTRLKARGDWNPPRGHPVADDQVHFMVQVMESWFLADREALSGYYGQRFRENRLPGNPRIEEIPKEDVLNGLREASRGTEKGLYHKTRHAPELLKRLNPARVRSASPHCDRLFACLFTFVQGRGSAPA